MMKRILCTLCVALIVAVQVLASDAFRVHRWESFHGLMPKETSIVFLGNSITNMHDWWEAYGGNHDILNRGTSGGFTYEVLPHLESVLMGHPDKVFIGIGTNDICVQASLDVTAENMRVIIERIRRESPKTKVYVQSLIPSTNDGNHVDGGGRNARVPAFNEKVKPIVEELNERLGEVYYLDVFSQLVASDGKSFKTLNGQSLAYDNLHPTVMGFGLWCKYIEPQVGNTCIYDTSVRTLYNGGQNNMTGDRITCFAQQPVGADDILFLGDEMVSSGEWHEWLQSGKVKNRGLGWGFPGSNLDQLVTNAGIYFQHKSSVAPQAILVYAGVQEASNGVAATTFKTKCQNLINGLRKKAPETMIYFITPLNTPNSSYNTTLASYKTQLGTLASSNEGVKVIDATTMNGKSKYFYQGDGGNYFTSYGYAKLSQIIEQAVKADFPDCGIKAITDEECTANNTLYAARTALGDLLTDVLRLMNKVGDGVGQYSAASTEDVNAKMEEAFALLSSTTATPAEFTALAEQLKAMAPQINMPKVSTDTEEHWYTFCSTNRSSRYLVSNGGEVIATDDGGKYATGQWKFVQRKNGTYDIVNRADGKMMRTATKGNSIPLSTTGPTTGWTLSACDAVSMYNVVSGTCEINVTNNAVSGGYKVVNWSAKDDGKDRADQGCQFTLAEVEGDPLDPPAPAEGCNYYVRLDGTALYFSTTEVADLKVTTYSLSSSREPFVITPQGTGYTIQSLTTDKYAGHGVTTSWDFSNTPSLWYIENLEGLPTTILKNTTKGFGVDNKYEGAGVYTDKEGQLWVFEPVETDGISELANEEISKLAHEGRYNLSGQPITRAPRYRSVILRNGEKRLR